MSYILIRSSRLEVFCNKLFQKISQNSLSNTRLKFFYNKVAGCNIFDESSCEFCFPFLYNSYIYITVMGGSFRSEEEAAGGVTNTKGNLTCKHYVDPKLTVSITTENSTETFHCGKYIMNHQKNLFKNKTYI